MQILIGEKSSNLWKLPAIARDPGWIGSDLYKNQSKFKNALFY